MDESDKDAFFELVLDMYFEGMPEMPARSSLFLVRLDVVIRKLLNKQDNLDEVDFAVA